MIKLTLILCLTVIGIARAGWDIPDNLRQEFITGLHTKKYTPDQIKQLAGEYDFIDDPDFDYYFKFVNPAPDFQRSSDTIIFEQRIALDVIRFDYENIVRTAAKPCTDVFAHNLWKMGVCIDAYKIEQCKAVNIARQRLNQSIKEIIQANIDPREVIVKHAQIIHDYDHANILDKIATNCLNHAQYEYNKYIEFDNGKRAGDDEILNAPDSFNYLYNMHVLKYEAGILLQHYNDH